MEFDGVGEDAVDAWDEWAGNGTAFGDGAGQWRLEVANAEGRVEVSIITRCTVFLCTTPFSPYLNCCRLLVHFELASVNNLNTEGVVHTPKH
jgi:hypothetical protein